jgi:hypothetical protein
VTPPAFGELYLAKYFGGLIYFISHTIKIGLKMRQHYIVVVVDGGDGDGERRVMACGCGSCFPQVSHGAMYTVAQKTVPMFSCFILFDL